ncbi:MAG: hypothetical protein ACJ8GO_20505 [Ramlibacter sp.]
MPSRSSPSTHSPKTSMSDPSRRSRSEVPSDPVRPKAAPGVRGPSEKKHKNMTEVRATGRQGNQGDKPGGTRKSRSK